MKKYRVTMTYQNRTRWIVLTAANKDQAELKAWQRLNPNDSDWGYVAKWDAKEIGESK
jgi:hypothetical protein